MPFPPACILLSRKSPLARRQAELAAAAIGQFAPQCQIETRLFVTTGDQQLAWSLEKSGGKGLFTSELENALLAGAGDVAVHSAKDLPTEMPAGLAIAGYLPRANPADVLVRRTDCPVPRKIASGSPRRRAQAKQIFPSATFVELRGNVDTRLKKIATGEADATFLAAAGLERLGITAWPGLCFEHWDLEKMIPAAGQAAIALQVRAEEFSVYQPLCDPATTRAVTIERAFLQALGEGCHTAFAVHYRDAAVHIFREDIGRRSFPFSSAAPVEEAVRRILDALFSKETGAD